MTEQNGQLFDSGIRGLSVDITQIHQYRYSSGILLVRLLKMLRTPIAACWTTTGSYASTLATYGSHRGTVSLDFSLVCSVGIRDKKPTKVNKSHSLEAKGLAIVRRM